MRKEIAEVEQDILRLKKKRSTLKQQGKIKELTFGT